jgi:hypothetical protein
MMGRTVTQLLECNVHKLFQTLIFQDEKVD